MSAADDVLATRRAGRVFVVDRSSRVLLLSGSDPSIPGAPTWWFTPGGGAEGDETTAQAATRELGEETGLVLDHPGSPVLERRASFDFDGIHYEQDEVYYLALVDHFVPSAAGWTEAERRVVSGYRWWSVAELVVTTETIHPPGIASTLERLLVGQDRSLRPDLP